MSERNEPAFPLVNEDGFPSHTSVVGDNVCSGVSKREYAAIQIMSGLLAMSSNPESVMALREISGMEKRTAPGHVARHAISLADALFDELEKDDG